MRHHLKGSQRSTTEGSGKDTVANRERGIELQAYEEKEGQESEEGDEGDEDDEGDEGDEGEQEEVLEVAVEAESDKDIGAPPVVPASPSDWLLSKVSIKSPP